MYRASGPVEMRPVGEVEFVAGIAAMSASGGYGPIKVAQGIVGFADLALGDRVEPVLEALIRAGGRPRFAAKEICRHRPSPKHGVLAYQLYHIWGSPEAGIS
jgi:L-fuconolactonase